MKNTLKSGFSLMEMMIVLLIVSIIAAATAPLITKKMARSAGGASGSSGPWISTGMNGNAAFNPKGNSVSAIIGARSIPFGGGHPRLYISTSGDNPALTMGNNNRLFNFRVSDNNATLNSNAAGGTLSVGDNTNSINLWASGNVTTPGTVNASTVESTTVNGSTVNGTTVNASTVESTTVNGSTVNSTTVNGTTVNASTVESTTVNGTTVNGTTVNGTTVSTTGLSVSGSATLGNDKDDSTNITGKLNVTGDANVSESLEVKHINCKGLLYQPKKKTPTEMSGFLTENTIVIGLVDNKDDETKLTVHGRAFIRDTLRVGSLAPINKNKIIDVDGNIRLTDSEYYIMARLGDFDELSEKTMKYIRDHYAASSDRRLKNVGEKFTGGLAELKRLDFFNFTYKKDEKKVPHVGVIAQDLQKVFPNAVTKDNDGYLQIRFEEILCSIINAVKELDNKLTELASQVKSNINLISKLQSQLEEEKQINKAQQKTIEELKAQNIEFEKRLARLEKSK